MDLFELLAEKSKRGEEFVLVTVVDTSGSVPAKTGFKMLVTRNTIEGTVGGGALENHAIEKARELLAQKGTAGFIRLSLKDLGMTCGGEVSLFMEPSLLKQNLWIFGGGHIARELVPIASSAGFRVTVVDNRKEFADTLRFPEAWSVVCDSYEQASRLMPDGTYVVIVTHGHQHDTQILLEALRKTPPLPYIGMIGSLKKVAQARELLKKEGVTNISNLYAPIGLETGGDSPAQIAVSIAAELLGVFYKKPNLPHFRNRLE